jgi:hypothetical protein
MSAAMRASAARVRERWLPFAGFVGLCAGLVAGCASVPEAPLVLPARNTLVREPLVIHSDFELPTQHRLLEELAAQRHELLDKLALPTSDEPIHVYLFESEQRFQTFLRASFPQLPVRRAFFVEDDTRLAVYAHWGDRVAEDLRHEVAHGHLHAVVPRIPLWLDEGLAEYFEVARGEQGLNRPHVKELVGRLSQGAWRPHLPRLEALASAGDMTQLDYAESWAWAHWMLDTSPARREVLRAYLAQLRSEGQAEPLSAALARAEPQADQAVADHLFELATAHH